VATNSKCSALRCKELAFIFIFMPQTRRLAQSEREGDVARFLVRGKMGVMAELTFAPVAFCHAPLATHATQCPLPEGKAKANISWGNVEGGERIQITEKRRCEYEKITRRKIYHLFLILENNILICLPKLSISKP